VAIGKGEVRQVQAATIKTSHRSVRGRYIRERRKGEKKSLLAKAVCCKKEQSPGGGKKAAEKISQGHTRKRGLNGVHAGKQTGIKGGKGDRVEIKIPYWAKRREEEGGCPVKLRFPSMFNWKCRNVHGSP